MKPILMRARRRLALAPLLAALLAAGSLLPAQRFAAAAVIFTVTTAGDQADLDPGDRLCDAVRAPGRQCTFRAAIQEANATPGRGSTIAFNIAGGGVHRIRPVSLLPPVTRPTVIDGYTQPGSRPNTAAVGTDAVLGVELKGIEDGGGGQGEFGSGLVIAAPNVVVRGLVINRFVIGVEVRENARNVRIEGCLIGTDPSGTHPRRMRFGVVVHGANATIGGTTPAARNLVAGNVYGVALDGPGNGSRVVGNLIGTARNGRSPLVADAAPGGDAPLGNAISGVSIDGSSGNTVGGDVAAAANVIAFNGDGVVVSGASGSGIGNRILRNAFFDNRWLGIDLRGGAETAGGATANDVGDVDVGPNNLQNRPVLLSARTGAGGTVVRGTLHSTPDAAFVLLFFSDPDGGTQGKVFRAQLLGVTTNADGNAIFTVALGGFLLSGQTITATATSAGGNTSEFSAPRPVT